MVSLVVRTAQVTCNETPMPSTVSLWMEADAIFQPSDIAVSTIYLT